MIVRLGKALFALGSFLALCSAYFAYSAHAKDISGTEQWLVVGVFCFAVGLFARYVLAGE